MPFQGFGFALWDFGTIGELEKKLQALLDEGYTHVELDPTCLDVYLSGRVNQMQLTRFEKIF